MPDCRVVFVAAVIVNVACHQLSMRSLGVDVGEPEKL